MGTSPGDISRRSYVRCHMQKQRSRHMLKQRFRHSCAIAVICTLGCVCIAIPMVKFSSQLLITKALTCLAVLVGWRSGAAPAEDRGKLPPGQLQLHLLRLLEVPLIFDSPFQLVLAHGEPKRGPQPQAGTPSVLPGRPGFSGSREVAARGGLPRQAVPNGGGGREQI